MDLAASDVTSIPQPALAPTEQRSSQTFQQFYLEHCEFLYRYVQYKRMSYNVDVDVVVDVGDVMQETMIAAFQDWPTVQRYAQPRHWLRRVAHNKLVDQIRRSSKRENVDVPAEQLTQVVGPGSVDGLDRVLWYETLAEAFGRMSGTQRLVMAQTVAGFTVEEIATTTGLSVEAVRKHRTRARAVIRRPRADTVETAPGSAPGMRPRRGLAAGALSGREAAQRFPELAHVLGRSPRSVGELDRVITLYTRVLGEREDRLGAGHPDVDVLRALLARTLCAAGRYESAVPLLTRILAVREKTVGADDPRAIAVCRELATAHARAGHRRAAIGLLERLLAHDRRRLGPDHPRTLATRTRLARTLQAGRQLMGAIEHYEQLLPAHERVLGPTHPHTVALRNDLAQALLDSAQYPQAIEVIEPLVLFNCRQHGHNHPRTLAVRFQLAHVMRESGHHGQAITLFEQVLAERQHVLGRAHPDTRATREDLARALMRAGMWRQAVPVLVEVLRDKERCCGPAHPQSSAIRRLLASAYESTQQYALATRHYEDNLRLYGPSDSGCSNISARVEALACRQALVRVLIADRDLDRALAQQRTLVVESEQLLGPSDLTTARIRDSFAGLRGLRPAAPLASTTRA